MSRSITQTLQQVMHKRDVVISGVVSLTTGTSDLPLAHRLVGQHRASSPAVFESFPFRREAVS